MSPGVSPCVQCGDGLEVTRAGPRASLMVEDEVAVHCATGSERGLSEDEGECHRMTRRFDICHNVRDSVTSIG